MALSQAQRATLVNHPRVEVDCRLERVDARGNVIEDISPWLRNGELSHESDQEVHRTIRIQLARELAWGKDRVRPTALISAAGLYDEVPMGVFMLTAPVYAGENTPTSYDVNGLDLLYRLNHSIDRTLIFDAAKDVLSHLDEVLLERGFPLNRIDRSAAGKTLTSPIVFPLPDKPTFLTVVNHLLGAIGYFSLWMDGDGIPTSAPYESLQTRTPNWTYDLTAKHTNASPEWRLDDNYTDAYNLWVVHRSDTSLGQTTEGDGLVSLPNNNEGPTSIQERDGLIIPRVEAVEAVDQAALELAALRFRAEDELRFRGIEITTGPNPYHGHNDVVALLDPKGVSNGKWQHRSWTYDLFGEADMTHDLRGLA